MYALLKVIFSNAESQMLIFAFESRTKEFMEVTSTQGIHLNLFLQFEY
jgi:hypothetical protein